MEINFIPHTSCTGCAACLNACPIGCISMKLDYEKFYYPDIDKNKCISCNKCKDACPIKNKNQINAGKPSAFAVVINDENIRLESSSGGVFSILSNLVLKRKGVVFGVALSEDCRQVKHIVIESEEELYKLRGSKYVQSSIGRSYQKAKVYLENERIVLFTGTPCQVEGLRSFLGKDYDNLYTVDLICHGVPSQYVWGKYLDYRERVEGSLVEKTYFRHKKYGWNMFSLLLKYANNREYIGVLSKDLYLQAFLNNANLRPCCYNCNFKTASRMSDFTMADLWGAEEICPEWYDDKGISLLLMHSEKGKDLVKEFESYARIKSIDLNLAIVHNNMAIKSMKAHPKRKKFINNVDKMEFDELVIKYGGSPFSLRHEVGNILRKLGLR